MYSALTVHEAVLENKGDLKGFWQAAIQFLKSFKSKASEESKQSGEKSLQKCNIRPLSPLRRFRVNEKTDVVIKMTLILWKV